MSIKEEIKEVGRLSHIVEVLLREGLETMVYELEIHTVVPIFLRGWHKLRGKAQFRRSHEESLVKALERLGGMFVKAGEFLSTRPDLVGKELAQELEQLEDQDLPFRFHPQMVDLKEFSEFEEKPLSAGSFGQIHYAKLKDGTPVAVKIQRPKIREKVEIDLKIIKWLLKRLKKKKPELKKFNLDELYQEIEKYTFQELDYRREAQNLIRLEKELKNNKQVVIPHVYPHLGNKTVLVMSWEEGEKLSKYYNQGGKSRKLAAALIESMTRQYFEYGFFQGDPSPGNFFVQQGKLVYLDLGLAGEFTLKERREVLRLLLALSGQEIEDITKYLIKLNIGKKINYENFHRSNKRIVEESAPAELFQNLFLNAADFGLKVPPDFILLGRSMMALAALVAELSPSTDLSKEMEPTIIECMKKELGYKPLIKFKLKQVNDQLFSGAEKAVDKVIEGI